PAGGTRLVAYVVTSQAPAPVAGDLRRFLLDKLPGYMVPSAFVTVGALPRTASGKVDRLALPAPAAPRPGQDPKFVAPPQPDRGGPGGHLGRRPRPRAGRRPR